MVGRSSNGAMVATASTGHANDHLENEPISPSINYTKSKHQANFKVVIHYAFGPERCKLTTLHRGYKLRVG